MVQAKKTDKAEKKELTLQQKMSNLMSVISMKSASGNADAQMIMDYAQVILSEGIKETPDHIQKAVGRVFLEIAKDGQAKIDAREGEK